MAIKIDVQALYQLSADFSAVKSGLGDRGGSINIAAGSVGHGGLSTAASSFTSKWSRRQTMMATYAGQLSSNAKKLADEWVQFDRRGAQKRGRLSPV